MSLSLTDLKCENTVTPNAVQTDRPRLSWKLAGERRGAVQTAYEIQAGSTRSAVSNGQADLWRTGCVESDASVLVPYGGPDLVSWQTVYWRVRVWDEEGEPTAWSETSEWSMGLLGEEAWADSAWIRAEDPRPEPETLDLGHWIWRSGDDPGEIFIMGRTFNLGRRDTVTEALLQAHALMGGEIAVNGTPVAAAVAWGRRAQASVGHLLVEGENTLAVRAHSKHGPGSHFAMALRIRRQDGSEEFIRTDEEWKWAPHPDGFHPFPPGDIALDQPVEARDHGEASTGVPPLPPHPAPMLRRDFDAGGGITRARLAICGLGYHEAFLNGKRLGDAVLEPGQTDYERRAYYVIHDVTDAVRDGANTLGVMLGDGFFNQDQTWGGMSYGLPVLRAVLRLEYPGGRTEHIITDGSWKATTDGPVRGSNVYRGETYDATRDMPGWAAPGFDDGSWHAAVPAPTPTRKLVAQECPPIRRVEERKPVQVLETGDGAWIANFGQNMAGWVRLAVDAPRGTVVRLRFAEALSPDGSGRLDPESTGVWATQWVQTDTYVCRGGGAETWEPRFSYHGFQYVEVTGLPGKLSGDSLTAVAVHSDLERVGSFRCSDETINQVHEMALWTLRGNLHSLPTDCPARERCGWLGDAHCVGEVLSYNYDGSGFWQKYTGDLLTASDRDGLPKMIAPGKRDCGRAAPDWGTAVMQVPWLRYIFHGDVRALEESAGLMARWLRHMKTLELEDGTIDEGLGDWCAPLGSGPDTIEKSYAPEAEIPKSSTAYYYNDLVIAARTFRLLGREREAEQYFADAERVRDAFIERFYDAEGHTFGHQTADSMALYYGLVPEGEELAIGEAMTRRLRGPEGGHLWTGIHGIRRIFWALCHYGDPAAAVDLFHADGYPGFNYLRELGATTLWERWGEGWLTRRAKPFYSMNHPMQAGFDAWFYSGLGGISPTDAEPGFKRVLLHPHLPPQIEWVEVEYDTPHGVFHSAWKRTGGRIEWKVTIPPNSGGLVVVPAPSSDDVHESGDALGAAAGIELLAAQEGWTAIDAGAGSYVFEFPDPHA